MAVDEARFTTRVAGADDAGTLIGLFNRAFHKEKDARTSRWKYFDGPHGASLTLIAEGIGDGESAPRAGGAYSYVYRRMTFCGRPFTGAQASDAMVDVAFRRRRIFTSFDDEAARRSAARGVPVAFAVAGRQSLQGFLGNGWREIGRYRTYVAVLDPAALLGDRLPRPLAALGGVLLGAALRVTGRRPALRAGGGTVRPAERFDERVDRLWERVKDDLPLAGVRDHAWLNWRYVDTPSRRHRVVLAERGDELVGYAVVEDAAGRGYVVDLLGLDAAAEDLVLAGALRHLRERGMAVAFLSTLPCPRLARLLARGGWFVHPRRRPFKTRTPFIVRVLRQDVDPPPAVLQDPRAWYVLDGDRDVEHVSPG